MAKQKQSPSSVEKAVGAYKRMQDAYKSLGEAKEFFDKLMKSLTPQESAKFFQTINK